AVGGRHDPGADFRVFRVRKIGVTGDRVGKVDDETFRIALVHTLLRTGVDADMRGDIAGYALLQRRDLVEDFRFHVARYAALEADEDTVADHVVLLSDVDAGAGPDIVALVREDLRRQRR